MAQPAVVVSAECKVCGDNKPMVNVGVRGAASSYTKNICTHVFCKECLFSWVESKVNERCLVIRCPEPDCKYALYPDDVLRLTNAEVAAQHKANKEVDHRKRLKGSGEGGVVVDKEFKAWSIANTKVCPTCHVIVLRSEGCNHMVCVCGAVFCYGCAKVQCQCNHSHVVCGFCSRKGHLKRSCPRIPCFACREKGHLASACPNTPVCTVCTKHHPLDATCSGPVVVVVPQQQLASLPSTSTLAQPLDELVLDASASVPAPTLASTLESPLESTVQVQLVVTAPELVISEPTNVPVADTPSPAPSPQQIPSPQQTLPQQTPLPQSLGAFTASLVTQRVASLITIFRRSLSQVVSDGQPSTPTPSEQQQSMVGAMSEPASPVFETVNA